MTSLFGLINSETPKYTLLAHFKGRYELRKYERQLRCEVQLPNERLTNSQGFRSLAGYIFGGNSSQTAPETSEKIAMTAPVVTARSASSPAASMAFILPSKYSDLKSLPRPHDPSVRLVEMPSMTYAVKQGSGSWDEQAVDTAVQELKQHLKEDGIKLDEEAKDLVLYCRYNPPWMPSFFRTNEVMVAVVYDKKTEE